MKIIKENLIEIIPYWYSECINRLFIRLFWVYSNRVLFIGLALLALYKGGD